MNVPSWRKSSNFLNPPFFWRQFQVVLNVGFRKVATCRTKSKPAQPARMGRDGEGGIGTCVPQMLGNLVILRSKSLAKPAVQVQ